MAKHPLHRLYESGIIFFLNYHLLRKWKSDKKRKRYHAERKFRTLCKNVPLKRGNIPKPIALDLGANIGNITAYLHGAGMQVYAFEPNPVCIDILNKRFAGNPDITIIPKAVGVSAGVLSFYRSESTDVKQTENASFIKRDIHDDNMKIDVEVIDIFQFMKALDKPLYLTKMDVEGAEFDILARMIEGEFYHEFGHLFVETHARFSEEYATRLQNYQKALFPYQHIDLYWQ